MLREAVGKIAADFGHDYFAEKVRSRRQDHRAVGGRRRGRLHRGQPARGVRRRRHGHHELAIGDRGAGRQRLPAAAADGLPRDLRLDHRPLRHAGPAGSAGCRRWPPARQDGVRHHRARRRLQLPQAVHRGHPRTATTGGSTAPSTTSPGSTRPRRSWWSPAPGSTRAAAAGKLSLFIVDTDAPGLENDADPGRACRAREAVHPLLRRRDGAGRPAARRRGRRAAPGLPRPQPGADHRRGRRQRHRPLRARQGDRLRQRAAGLGRADRRPPGPGPPAGRGEDRASSWPA